jgi:D-lactate dehydrogenase
MHSAAPTERPRLLDASTISALRRVVGAGALLTDVADRHVYGGDNSRLHAMPDAVVLAASEEQLQALVAFASDRAIALTARGRGTATTGAAVPIAGGIVVSFERMDRLVRIESDDRLVVVEPGLINGELQRQLASGGFFWPPDPTSSPYATIGGNLACNAGGPRTVKYGASRDNLLAMRVVTGRGELISSGSRSSKTAVGYDLCRLFCGAEGTLGLISQATLKLTPAAPARRALRALYADAHAATRAVARIMAQASTPSALEFLDAGALALVRRDPAVQLPPGDALLLLEVDGHPDELTRAAAAVAAAAAVEGLLEWAEAGDPQQAQALWAARKALSPALRQVAPKKINEDVVVPVSRLPLLLEGLQQLAARHQITIINFGHAGNGNVHVNLLYDPAVAGRSAAAQACLADVFELVFELEGTLSGEHGIGLLKRQFMTRAIPPATLALMHQIKHVFDPAGIFNPGKLLPEL